MMTIKVKMVLSLLGQLFLLILFVVCITFQTIFGSIILKGPYIGQKPPGTKSKIFAPDFISSDKNEVNSVFTPDGKEFYFSIFDPNIGYTIMFTKETLAGWSKPKAVSFSSKYSEVDVFITEDGKKLFYISKRPIKQNGPPSRAYQIWSLDRLDDHWVNPTHLGPDINFGTRQLYPTLSNNGTLYYNSDKNSYGKGDFFRSEFIEGKYASPENLGQSINTEYDETDPLIAPDESFIIFTSISRPDGFGSGDLYISFRNDDGSWKLAINMGKDINTNSSEFAPILSPDGKFLFFTSDRRGNNDIYWVDAKIIQTYNKESK